MNFSFKLNLKRKGRYKKPYFNIAVLNKNNKIVEILGGLTIFGLKKVKTLRVNLFLVYYWLSKGLQFSFFLFKFFKLIFNF